MRIMTESEGQLRREFVTSVHHVALRCPEIEFSRALVNFENFENFELAQFEKVAYYKEIRWVDIEDMFAGYMYPDMLPHWYLALVNNDRDRLELFKNRDLINWRISIHKSSTFSCSLVYLLDSHTSNRVLFRVLQELVDLG